MLHCDSTPLAILVDILPSENSSETEATVHHFVSYPDISVLDCAQDFIIVSLVTLWTAEDSHKCLCLFYKQYNLNHLSDSP